MLCGCVVRFAAGAVVIDIGINRIKDKNGKTQLVGDCDFEGISQVFLLLHIQLWVFMCVMCRLLGR